MSASPGCRAEHWPTALKRLREDYLRVGGKAGFAAYLDDLRQRQRRKTSFIAKLDAAFAISGVPVRG
jgi:hypothetical protein